MGRGKRAQSRGSRPDDEDIVKPQVNKIKTHDKTKLVDVRSDDSTTASGASTTALLAELAKRLEEVNIAEDMNQYSKLKMILKPAESSSSAALMARLRRPGPPLGRWMSSCHQHLRPRTPKLSLKIMLWSMKSSF